MPSLSANKKKRRKKEEKRIRKNLIKKLKARALQLNGIKLNKDTDTSTMKRKSEKWKMGNGIH